MEVETLRHFLILCCYGGAPFIDYSAIGTQVRHEATRSMDPTDWIAVDSSGSLLNDTIHPEILAQNPFLSSLIPVDTPLDQCDLYNLTFSSAADEHLFELEHGHLTCRCPFGRTGIACQSHEPTPAALSAVEHPVMSPDPFSAYLVACLFLMVAMFLLLSMMRGCFCDCFGGCRNPFRRPKDERLDPEAVRRCQQAVRQYEEKQHTGFDARRPLITSVSETCGAAPYNDTVQPPLPPSAPRAPLYAAPTPSAPPPPRACSPPPSYRSETGSHEFLPGVGTNTQL